MDQTTGIASGAIEEGIYGVFSSTVVGKRVNGHSSHHWEVSKKCPKLLPSPGFEPRPFDVSEQAI